MPTESAFFFAGLLFLAAALGYIFARFGEVDEDEEQRESTRADFLRGFRYLLNEEPDRAVDVFTGVERIGAEGVETQLALGALFRRQGQLDRAIKLHQHLIERPGLSGFQRDQAGFALADDYLSAGLLDRAEDLLRDLRTSSTHSQEAARRLLRIAEFSSDWPRAVKLGEQLLGAENGGIPGEQLAHYHCELADSALKEKDHRAAGNALARAAEVAPRLPRVLLLHADLARGEGDEMKAVQGYGEVASVAPELVGELLPRLATIEAEPGRAAVSQLISALCAGERGEREALAVALVRHPEVGMPEALACLGHYVRANPVLAELTAGVGDDEAPGHLQRWRGALARIAARSAPYRCGNCGYASLTLQWQCPGCRTWGSVSPLNQLFPGPGPS